MKINRAPVHREHAVQHEGMEVDVEIEGAAEALHDGDGAAPPIRDAITPGPTPQEPEHRPQSHAGHDPTQLVIPREQVPQPMRQTRAATGPPPCGLSSGSRSTGGMSAEPWKKRRRA